MELLSKIGIKAFVFLMMVCGHHMVAQNNLQSSDDAARITLVTVIPSKVASMSEEAKEVLKSKLNQITTKNGLGGSGVSKRFVITAGATVLTKDIAPTVPAIYTYNLEVTLYIADGIDGTLFASHALSLKGTAKSDTKAYIAALKEINASDKQYAAFIDEGKRKIVEYYNSQCDFMLKAAQAKADQREFDAAIASLVEVPDVCKDCFNKAKNLSVSIHRSKLELECQQNIAKAKVEMSEQDWGAAAKLMSLYTPDMGCYKDVTALLQEINANICAEKVNKAKAEWASRNTAGALGFLSQVPPNSVCEAEAMALLQEVKDGQCADNLGKAKGAWSSRNSKDAAKFLGEIPTDSKCAGEAGKLGSEIAASLDAAAKAAWDFELKKYQDDINLTYRKLDSDERQATRNQELEKMVIQASRDVGVAYAQNQADIIYEYSDWPWYLY
jgi:hypothetical protein